METGLDDLETSGPYVRLLTRAVPT
jgi:hypothetical protein